jgi:hypothetical protein
MSFTNSRVKHMKKLIAAALLVPSMAISQELVEFKNGQVADAEKLNQNFATLAARIQLESGGEPFYTFLGYTESSFEDYANETQTDAGLNQIRASQHCKYEFGASAFAATTDVIEYFILTGDSFYLPATEAIIFVGIDTSSNFGPKRITRVITKSGEVDSGANASDPVACVKITGLP